MEPRPPRRAALKRRSNPTPIKSWLAAGAVVAAIAVGIGLRGRASEHPQVAAPLLTEAEALFDRAQGMVPDEDAAVPPSSAPRWGEARQLFAQAAQKFSLAGNDRRRARALHQVAWCARPGHDPAGTWPEAIRLFEEAAALSEAAGDRAGWAVSLRMKGVCLQDRPDRDLSTALAIADEVIARCRTDNGLSKSLGDALHDRAWCLQPDNNAKCKDWAPCLAAYEEAEQVHSKLAPTRWSRLQQANAAYQQGWGWQPGHHPEGSWPRAIQHYERAIELFAAAPDVGGRADGLRQLGKALIASSDSGDAWTRGTIALQNAADLYAETRNRSEEARVLEFLGRATRPDRDQRGSWARAAEVYARLSTHYSDAESWQLGEALFAQALCRCEGDWKRAGIGERELVHRAEAALRKADDDERADEIVAVLK